MESLYGIEAKLDRIFNEIEEAEGEMTPEQAEELEINEFNLREKLTSYVHYVDVLNSYVEGIKQKSIHLDTRKKVLENRIKKSKNIMLEAVEKYGLQGKNNKYIELDECRLYTKNSSSGVIIESQVDILNKCILVLVKAYQEDFPKTEEELLNKLNDIYKMYYDNNDSFEKQEIPKDYLFTKDDIRNYKFTISKEYSIKDLLNQNLGIAKDISNEEDLVSNYKFQSLIGKSDIKDLIKTNNNITIGYIDNKNNLQIK